MFDALWQESRRDSSSMYTFTLDTTAAFFVPVCNS